MSETIPEETPAPTTSPTLGEEPVDDPIKESTLELYGHCLPIGVTSPGSAELAKAFSFAKLDYALEAKIDKSRNRKGGPGNHPGKVATEVLAQVLTEWGGDTDFATKNHVHKLAALQLSFMEDVLYAWVCLRVETMGADLAIEWECASCDHEWPWETDLSKLEAHVVDVIPPSVPVELVYPISWGTETITAVELIPPKWGAICNIKGAQRRGGFGDIKAGLVRTAIRAVRTESGKELPLAPRVFEQLHKLDRERMTKKLDSKAFPHCDLTFEVECPECMFVQRTALDWTWDFFFGSASLPSV